MPNAAPPPFSRYGQGDQYMSWRQILTDSGYDCDVYPFPGLMGPVWNLKANGARIDGTTDDSAAFQDAVNRIPTSGGTIIAPDGICMLGATVTLPTDRLVRVLGMGSHCTNQSGGTFGGTIFRRRSGQSGPMFSQSTSGSALHGLRLADVVLDGNNQSNDLLVFSHVHQSRLERVVFFNSSGHGLHATSLINAYISECGFFELGGASAYSLLLDADGVGGGCVTVFITNPHFEVGRGTYFRTVDSTGTNPNSQIVVLGGKCEFSGNNGATTPAVPFIDWNNTVDSNIIGHVGINGQSNGATHIKLSNCNRINLDTQHHVNTATDALNPQYLVHVNGAAQVTVRGSYNRGGGNSGAQIRVESSSSDVTIDPTNKYTNPINVPVSWGSTPGSQERTGSGWTGLQSTTAMALGAGTTLEGPARGNSIARVTTGGSNIVISAGNKGDIFLIVHQGTTVPIEFNPTDATSRVYFAQSATIYPGEAGLFVWDSTLALWVKSTQRQHSIQSPSFAASFTPLPLSGEIIEVGALTNNITINDVSTNHKRKGMILTFRFLQDGTGGRTVTWNAVYKQAWVDTGNTANKKSTISFYCTDGTNFEQLGAQSPYF